MDKFILPEYDNSIVSLASSIRRYFELDVYHNTLSDIDKILDDGMNKTTLIAKNKYNEVIKKVGLGR